MLSVVDKNGRPVRPLGAAEFEAMLAAFARAGATAAARTRGAGVVRTVQQQDRWFRCHCLGTEPAPILVPVVEHFIRRSPYHSDHADGCPFETGDVASAGYAKGVREPRPGDVFRLVGAAGPDDIVPFPDDDGGEAAGDAPWAGPRRGRRGVCKVYERNTLSQVLFKLLSDTLVQRVGRGPRGPADQWEAVYRAARGIPLGEDLPLSDVLHTDPGQLDLLVGCINARPRWPKGRRPHGVLMFTAARIEGEVIVAASGARVAVEGPIAVFGPGRGTTRIGPFIVAVLVASPDGYAPPGPVKAYAQPCWLAEDILPVDSSHERRTLDTLMRFRAWMAEHGYAVEITKPLYDRSRYYFGERDAEQVVKPDFEGTIHAVDGHKFIRSLVVETMGIDTEDYRAKKKRLKEILTSKPGQYLEHRAYDGAMQADNDRRFRQDLFEFGTRIMERQSRAGRR